ncbi:hypothetical protein BS78_07G122500 [Paspalum vaginatum]|nr:hypothetical protein BS78_07G122500 [Paspalum vaginatum]
MVAASPGVLAPDSQGTDGDGQQPADRRPPRSRRQAGGRSGQRQPRRARSRRWEPARLGGRRRRRRRSSTGTRREGWRLHSRNRQPEPAEAAVAGARRARGQLSSEGALRSVAKDRNS